jgi:hypothetical protein
MTVGSVAPIESVGVTSPRSAEIITTDGKDGKAIRGISIVAAVAAEGSLRIRDASAMRLK